MIVDDPQIQFRLLLVTVVIQAYTAAGYTLDERPDQWAGGLFRFVKPFEAGPYAGMMAAIEYQHLYFPENAVGQFRVSVVRSALPRQTLAPGQIPVRRILTGLLWADFGVRVLPDPEYWWSYATVTELGAALAESGHLLVGYGIPWLAGDLAAPPRG